MKNPCCFTASALCLPVAVFFAGQRVGSDAFSVTRNQGHLGFKTNLQTSSSGNSWQQHRMLAGDSFASMAVLNGIDSVGSTFDVSSSVLGEPVRSSSSSLFAFLPTSIWIADATAEFGGGEGAGPNSVTAMIAKDPMLVLALGVTVAALAGLTVLQTVNQTEQEAAVAEATKSTGSSGSTSDVSKADEKTPVADSAPSIEDGKDLEEDAVVFGMDDEWTAQGKEADEAFQSGNRGKLRQVIGGLLGSIRSAQNKVQSERELREAAQADLKVVGEKFRDLEDQYELEQNQLQKTTKALETTQSQWTTTQRHLEDATVTLTELQKERKSLRKLGRVAWNLSKDRVQTRLQKVRSRLRGDDDDDSDETDK